MTGKAVDRVRRAVGDASSQSALCAYLADSLGSDPATSVISEAVEGLGTLAQRIADSLANIADPD